MKRKKIIYILSLCAVVSVVLYLFNKKNQVDIYIGIANPSESIDLKVSMNDKEILNDSLKYNPFQYRHIRKDLRFGLYRIKVQSESYKISANSSILIFKEQDIVIEYYPKDQDNNEKHFLIRNLFSSFYYE